MGFVQVCRIWLPERLRAMDTSTLNKEMDQPVAQWNLLGHGVTEDISMIASAKGIYHQLNTSGATRLHDPIQ
jgi:hypothetical protein